MAENSILFITGANTGLGLETVKSLYQSTETYTILLGGRDLGKAKAAAEEVQKESSGSSSVIYPVQIDISSDESISKAFDHIKEQYGRVDTLINNAGTQLDQQLQAGKISMREMWNQSWDVNTTGTYILTHTFVPLLLKSSDARLMFITSGTSTLTESDNLALAVNRSPPKGWPKEAFALPAYRSTKTGLNMMMREWHRVLKEDGVKVWGISPGQLATGLGSGQEANKKMGAIDPSIGANFVRDVVEGARDEDVGKVIRKANVQPW
ncbi:hypothetical protein B0J14DRAFT_674252 [Halenospora varia]|nr:hypothetical protein B0J14DRAFT_674252 [Halenospora varia]